MFATKRRTTARLSLAAENLAGRGFADAAVIGSRLLAAARNLAGNTARAGIDNVRMEGDKRGYRRIVGGVIEWAFRTPGRRRGRGSREMPAIGECPDLRLRFYMSRRAPVRADRWVEFGMTDTKRGAWAQRYDVSLKSPFLREGDGIIRRLLFGGKAVEFLATEQPQIFNRRADLVLRSDDGFLHHIEFQTSNEAGFGLRMLEYYTYPARLHKQRIIQTVLYLGREPPRLKPVYKSPSIRFRFEIVNLREYDSALLPASEDWADNVLALLAKGEPEKVLEAVLAGSAP